MEKPETNKIDDGTFLRAYVNKDPAWCVARHLQDRVGTLTDASHDPDAYGFKSIQAAYGYISAI
jgi:hypothetical protein